MINNTGTATAYDLVLTDTLDSNLELVAPESSRVVMTATPSSYVITLGTSGNTGSAVSATLSELRVGDSVTVRITARVKSTAPAKQTIANGAGLTYTSLPGPDAGERTGAGDVNKYSTAATSASFILAQPTVDKSFKNGSATDDATSVASSTGANVVIGEQVTYDILVTLPDGVTKALKVIDSLPAGLRFESYEIITAVGSAAHQSTLLSQPFDGTLPSLTSPPTAQDGPATLTFDFGDTTTGADTTSANNSFVIRFVATVRNIIENQETYTRANTATLTFTDPNDPPQTITKTDSNAGNDPVVTIVEPTLTVAKTVDKPTADAGDSLTYTITVANSSSTQLGYDTALDDALPSKLFASSVLGGTDFTTAGYSTPVRAATTGPLGGTRDSGNAGQFTGVTVPLVVDGVALALTDRVLVKDEASPAQNGIYVVSALGGTATLVRADDFKTTGQMTSGYLAMVSAGGTADGGKVFRLVSSVGTVNTDAVTWAYYATYQVPTAATFHITVGALGDTLGVASGASLYLPPNGSVTLKVRGILAESVTPNETLANDAYVYWGSADSTVTDRRDGSGIPTPSLSVPNPAILNNYAVASSASTTVPVMTASKSLFGTDQTETSDANVTIGELVTCALKVNLPEGTTPDLTVVDHLPSGMQHTSYSVVRTVAGSGGLLAGDFIGTIPKPSVSGGTSDGAAVTFVFGEIKPTVTTQVEMEANSG